MEQICINAPEAWASIAGGVVMVASVLANVIPNSGTAKNPALKLLTTAVNWLAFNFKVNTNKPAED